MTTDNPSTPAANAQKSVATSAVPRISSAALLGEREELEIEHDGQIYRLRRTALGKLILTK